MNNELRKHWDYLVAYSKNGRIEFSDAAIIAADELIKEQQAEIEHYKNQLDRACGDGNTPADFDKLRDANLALAMESHQQQAHIERLLEAINKLLEAIDNHYPDSPEFAALYCDAKRMIFLDATNLLAETPAKSLEALSKERSND